MPGDGEKEDYYGGPRALPLPPPPLTLSSPNPFFPPVSSETTYRIVHHQDNIVGLNSDRSIGLGDGYAKPVLYVTRIDRREELEY